MAPLFPEASRGCLRDGPTQRFIYFQQRPFMTAIRPARGMSISVIIEMTIARRIGKTNRSAIAGRPEASCASRSLERTRNKPILDGYSEILQLLAQKWGDLSGKIDRDMRALTRFSGELLYVGSETGRACRPGSVIPL